MAAVTTQHAAGRAVLYNFLLNEVLASQIANGETFYVVSPWISDFPLDDRYVGAFDEVVSGGDDRLRLFDVVRQIAANGTPVVLVTGDDERYIRPLVSLLDRTPGIALRRHGSLHAKVYAGVRAAIVGSVNLTQRGLHHNTEALTFYHDDHHILTYRQMCKSLFDAAEEVR